MSISRQSTRFGKHRQTSYKRSTDQELVYMYVHKNNIPLAYVEIFCFVDGKRSNRCETPVRIPAGWNHKTDGNWWTRNLKSSNWYSRSIGSPKWQNWTSKGREVFRSNNKGNFWRRCCIEMLVARPMNSVIRRRNEEKRQIYQHESIKKTSQRLWRISIRKEDALRRQAGRAGSWSKR